MSNHSHTMTSKHLAIKLCLIANKFNVRLDTTDNQSSTNIRVKCLRATFISHFCSNSAGFMWRRRNNIVHNHAAISPRKATIRLEKMYQAYKQAWEQNSNQRLNWTGTSTFKSMELVFWCSSNKLFLYVFSCMSRFRRQYIKNMDLKNFNNQSSHIRSLNNSPSFHN